MKYAVIGLGAVGSIVGGLLAYSKEDVILFGKKYQIEILREKGLEVMGVKRGFTVKNLKVSADISLTRNVDILFVCVKSQDTEEIAVHLKKYINGSTLIVSLQNGVRNAQILHEKTGNRVISGIVLFNALCLQAGEVALTLKGGVLLEKDKQFGDVLVSSLNNAGLKTSFVKDIEGYLWSKLILNLQIAITALTGQTIKESIVDKDSRKIIITTLEEGVSIVQQSNIPLKVLPEIDPLRMIKRLRRFNSLFLRLGARVMGLKENARNSMWQSLARGRSTEIDYINGEIVKLADKNNLGVPINKKLVELIKKAETEQRVNNLDPSELRNILGI